MKHTALVLALIAGCGIEAPDDDTAGSPEVTEQQQEIVGGEATTQFQAVGYMRTPSERCTGTLIAPNAFLTAAHCVQGAGPYVVGFDGYESGAEVPVSGIYVSPGYVDNQIPHDVAVLVLSYSINHEMLPLAGSEYPDATPVGRELRAIGYGDDVSGETSPGSGARPRKTAHVSVAYVETYKIDTLGINGAGCFGDSGGPLMDLNGTKVYAVFSKLNVPCNSQDRSYYAAIAYEPFIYDVIYNNPPAPAAAATPLWRYFNNGVTDHFYTINRNDGGYGYFGYGIETYEGRVINGAYPGTVPLYRYWNPAATDHFYTANYGELGAGAYGYALEGVEGYVFPRPYRGTIPLYRYWNPYGLDHFYTVNRNDAGYAYYGYSIEAVVGYIYP